MSTTNALINIVSKNTLTKIQKRATGIDETVTVKEEDYVTY